MFINEILTIHTAHLAEAYPADDSSPDILGDGFLMEFNPIYRNIKVFALEIGCIFKEAWPQYLLLPFHELNKIVTDKHIPFVPSGRLLREIEAKAPLAFTTADVRMPDSYHLHESAHVIAEHLFSDMSFASDHEKIVKMIMCESFANTVDAMAWIAADTEFHRFFLEHNCYMRPTVKDRALLLRLSQTLGGRATFMLTFFAYVTANFLKSPQSKKVVRDTAARYAPSVKLTEKILKDAVGLAVVAEKLDPQFRVQTTGAYLKLEGFTGDIFSILDFSFSKVFEANAKFRDKAEAMARTAGG